ncbi:hypothetical protein GSI_04307 [Ganoderma sinense ZZ0214-1]|uniref:Uncharacterized protein n=1 Tax=Ganoderma sinense ZZ0214-1 TaxID=1077348 RepID=A0A2G8SIS9_9APHY|nr:hypothetical protein GSI_04307 [Ganoderma sinense ZZ0214-1]
MAGASASRASVASIRTSPVSRPPSLHTVHEKAGKTSSEHATGGKMKRSPLQDICVQRDTEPDVKQRRRRDSVDSTASRSSRISTVSKSSQKSKWTSRMANLKLKQQIDDRGKRELVLTRKHVEVETVLK